MDVRATLDAPCGAHAMFACVDDLARYPSWLDIVPRAEPASGGEGPVWTVDLRGRLGPFARTKRLRMVRAEHRPPETVRFERREIDGRSHAPWTLSATVSSTPGGSHLVMHLHYGGSLFVPVLERLLGDEIERSKPRLLALCRLDPA